MIASFSNNFIFLKSRKTGGTSVEILLGTWCGGRDIVTEMMLPADEEVRTQYGGRPMNFGPKWYRPGFTEHQKAVDVRRRMPLLWRRAFKFAIERHPYERVVSRAYWWIHRRGGDPTQEFEAELERVLRATHGVNNRDIYCIDDKIAVDEVILYDNLWPRMAELAAKFGRTLPTELPRAKGGYRADRRPALEILTDAQKERIYQMTRADFEEFGFAR